MGSPTVPSERLSASECIAAIKAMMEYNHHAEFDAVMGVEIGGSNGLQPLTVGSTKNFGRPVVDADWMGIVSPQPQLQLTSKTNTVYHRPGIPKSMASYRCSARREPDCPMLDRLRRRTCLDHDQYTG
jgi:DUF917 family protein